MKPKVLLFDLDQTLLASSAFKLKYHFIFRAVKLLRARGISFSDALQFLGEMKKTLAIGDAKRTNAVRIYDLLKSRRTQLSDLEAKVWIDSWVKEVFEGLVHYFSSIEEGEKLVHELRGKSSYRLILATNPAWPKTVTELRLNRGSLRASHFEWVTTADQMHFMKPDPRYYQEILSILGVPAQDCLMIGDSFKKDAPATMIGIPVFILRKENLVHSPVLSQGPYSELRKRLT
jgi:HAD superfamily hydrolase (TIGR01549 family)